MRSRNFPTLVTLLCDRVNREPDRSVYTFLTSDETASKSLTYRQLDSQARAIAAQLQSWIKPGDRVLLLYPFSASLDFIQGFWGCLYAGAIAVTDNPPRNLKTLYQLQERINDSQASIILTTQAFRDRLFAQLPDDLDLAKALKSLPWLTTDIISAATAKNWSEPLLTPDSIAFLQYTSGSTGRPKGVAIAHRNVLHNCAAIEQAFNLTVEDRGLIWLPLFHDMGLIGGVMQPIYSQFPVFFLSPLNFIQQPFCWLQAISHHHITVSGGPNFAYDLLCEKVTPQQKETLDLQRWKVAFIGAEPIRSATLKQFAETFESCGFHPTAFLPCYGMAETTVMISGGKNSDLVSILPLDRLALAENRVVLQKITENPDLTKTVVSCGFVGLGMEIKIVHPQKQVECPADEIGEIWVAGGSVGQGYWQHPQATQQHFQAFLNDTQEGPFLRTGDLGFIREGQVFIAGRLKEMMILWGRNHYPHKIEETIENSHAALKANSGAAFSVEVAGEERLVIAHEIKRTFIKKLDCDAVINAMCKAVMENHLAEIYGIILLKPGSLPKTTSGKIQRQLCKTKFLEKHFEPLEFWQSPSSFNSSLQLLNLPN